MEVRKKKGKGGRQTNGAGLRVTEEAAEQERKGDPSRDRGWQLTRCRGINDEHLEIRIRQWLGKIKNG